MSKIKSLKRGMIAIPIFGIAAISSAVLVGAAPSTSAVTSSGSTVVTATVGSVISIGADAINVNISAPSPSGTFATGTGSVTVTTNDATGYSVYLTSDSSTSTSLDHETITTSKINSISAAETIDGTTTTQFSAVNTWGWSKDGSTFYPVVTKGTKSTAAIPTLYRKTNTPSISGDVSTLTIGVTGNSSLISGTYSGTLLLTAITNSDTTSLAQYDNTL